jgi:hypothetical protein
MKRLKELIKRIARRLKYGKHATRVLELEKEIEKLEQMKKVAAKIGKKFEKSEEYKEAAKKVVEEMEIDEKIKKALEEIEKLGK